MRNWVPLAALLLMPSALVVFEYAVDVGEGAAQPGRLPSIGDEKPTPPSLIDESKSPADPTDRTLNTQAIDPGAESARGLFAKREKRENRERVVRSDSRDSTFRKQEALRKQEVEINQALRASRWWAEGQCLDGAALGDRARYLASFTEVFHRTKAAPQTPEWAWETAAGALGEARMKAIAGLNLWLYVHENEHDLRRHACVTDGALSYYDGDIHVAVLEGVDEGTNTIELQKSVLHEYAHHYLISRGIAKPVWLHEGFAQTFAGEKKDPLSRTPSPLDLSQMVEPLSVRSGAEDVAAFYFQAALMFQFLTELRPARNWQESNDRPMSVVSDLKDALMTATATFDELFLWATARYSKDLEQADPLRLWESYYEQGDFSEETRRKLAARSASN